MRTYAFYVSGANRRVAATTWRIEAVTNGRWTCELDVPSTDGSFYGGTIGDDVWPSEAVGIVSASAANPTVITTDEPHGCVTGQLVTVGGNTQVPTNTYRVTVVSPTTVSIPTGLAVAGSGGTLARRIFGGEITKPTTAGVGGNGLPPVMNAIEAGDYSARAERRYINTTIPEGSLKSQLQVLATAIPGIALHPSQVDGPIMPQITLTYILVRDVLNQLGVAAGDWPWEIDEYAFLRMYAPGTDVCPVNVIDGNGVAIGDITVYPTRDQYANRVILRFSDVAHAAYAFMSASAQFADGEQVVIGSTTYTFRAAPAAANDVAIGPAVVDSLNNLIAGIMTGATGGSPNSQVGAYLFTPGSIKVIASTPGASGNSIGVSTTAANARWFGEGNVPLSTLALGADEALTNVSIAADPSSVTNPWEAVIEAPDVTSLDDANQLSAAYLAAKFIEPKIVEFTTMALGIRPGQSLTIRVASRGINNTYLVTQVNTTCPDGVHVFRDVTAVESYSIHAADRWRELYKQWSKTAPAQSGAATSIAGGGGGSGGGGGVAGSGTIGKLAEWTAATTLGDGPIAANVILSTGSYPNPPWLTAIGLDKFAPIPPLTLLGNAGGSAAPPTALGPAAARGVLGLATTDTPTFAGLVLTGSAVIGGSAAIAGNVGTPSYVAQTTGWRITPAGAADVRSLYADTATIAGTLTLGGNLTVAGFVGSPSYTSQLTGWRITAAGAADVRYLFADELHTRAFIADLEQALAGGQIISKSVAKVATTANGGFRVGTDTQLIVESFAGFATASVFQDGDTVRLRSFARAAGALTVTDAFGTVALDTTYGAGGYDAGTMTQRYTFTKTSGSNILANTGTLALDYGVSGNGYYEVTAVDGTWGAAAPYAQVVTWSGSPSTLTCRTRLGNVSGVFGTAGEYGLFAGDYAGKRYLRASSAGVELHGLDFLLWDGTITTFKLDHTVPSFAMGNPVPTGYGTGTGTGLWMGKDTVDGKYKFRIGTPGSAGMFWDGSSLTITGVSGGALTGVPTGGAANDVNTYSTTINGGKITTGSLSATKSIAIGAGAALNDDPDMYDASAWTGNAFTLNNVGGRQFMYSTVVSGTVFSARHVAVDQLKTYRIRMYVFNGNSDGVLYAGIALYDSAGTNIGGDGAYWYYLMYSAAPTVNTWLEFVGTFGLGTVDSGIAGGVHAVKGPFPSNAASMQIVLWFNYAGSGNGYYAISAPRIEEVLPSTLIQDGAITTNKITAGAVTTAKLLVGNDAALNDDPSCADPSAWSFDHASVITTDTPVGSHALHGAGTTSPYAVSLKHIPVTTTKTYRLHCMARRSPDANGVLYAGLTYYNYAGTQVGLNYPCASGVLVSTAWSTYDGTLSLANGLMPAGTTNVTLLFYLNYSNTAGWVECTDIRLEEMSPSTLIQDGAITTNKIFAGAVTAGQIAASTITGGNIAASTITGANIAAGSITAGNIAAGSFVSVGGAAGDVNAGTTTISGGKITAASITSTQIAASTITAGNIAAGTITSTQIAAGSITADRLNVSTLSAITANLGTVTAGAINGLTISGGVVTGATVIGGSGTITLDGGGLHFSGSGGAAQIDMNGALIQHFNGGVNGLTETNWISVQGGLFNNSDMSAGGQLFCVGRLTTQSDFYTSGNIFAASMVAFVGGTSTPVYWNPSPNNGLLSRGSSSRRYKENILAWTPAPTASILTAQPAVFNFKGGTTILGFIAEDFEVIDPLLVIHDLDGRPDGIHHEALFAHVVVALQDVARRLAAIEGHA